MAQLEYTAVLQTGMFRVSDHVDKLHKNIFFQHTVLPQGHVMRFGH